MTATPSPRTLAQTAYADLDVSIIDELPPGRTPVETVVISEQRRDEVVARVHSACREGRQAYWVCPLVEESENLQCQAAQQSADALSQALPDLRIGLVHGRLKAGEKAAVMTAFKAGDIDLLVATTVIEVGVDVPNASLMIIDNAERLGLSQLHQLRGRVGRGAEKSSCVLLYGAALSTTAKARLSTLRETNDGFVVAQRDLELRGPGELLGTRQTGLINMRIADFQRDAGMIPLVSECSEQLLRDYPAVVPALIQRWLGEGLRYSEV
jgi:ATP-dependent DNA helicase RecG